MYRCLLIFCVWIALPGLAFAGMGGKLPFSKDYQRGMAEAKRAGKPFVLYFSADW